MVGDCSPRASWSKWFNEDGPSGKGDFEVLAPLVKKKRTCASPSAMQVRTTDGRSFRSAGTKAVPMLRKGFVCINDGDRKCDSCA